MAEKQSISPDLGAESPNAIMGALDAHMVTSGQAQLRHGAEQNEGHAVPSRSLLEALRQQSSGVEIR